MAPFFFVSACVYIAVAIATLAAAMGVAIAAAMLLELLLRPWLEPQLRYAENDAAMDKRTTLYFSSKCLRFSFPATYYPKHSALACK